MNTWEKGVCEEKGRRNVGKGRMKEGGMGAWQRGGEV